MSLTQSSSLTEAAEKAGIDRRTLYNYLHNDIDFTRAYEEIRSRQAVSYMDELTEQRQRAHAVIMELLEDTEQPASIRLKAAQVILTAAEEQEKIIGGIIASNISKNDPLNIFSMLD